MINQPDVTRIKNQWLSSQIDVEFPTPESLQGRTLYLQTQAVKSCQELLMNSNFDFALLEDIYLVDFHRLTVMFSALQATQWKNEKDKANIIEFFTQIIYGEPCELYLGFHQGEAIAAGIVTHTNLESLVSDLVVPPNSPFINKNTFAQMLLTKSCHHSIHEAVSLFIEE